MTVVKLCDGSKEHFPRPSSQAETLYENIFRVSAGNRGWTQRRPKGDPKERSCLVARVCDWVTGALYVAGSVKTDDSALPLERCGETEEVRGTAWGPWVETSRSSPRNTPSTPNPILDSGNFGTVKFPLQDKKRKRKSAFPTRERTPRAIVVVIGWLRLVN
ncbi:hypothetical protein EYF80_007880 [Liparis tanakae]|uniref:Uncharacterized protein n=1 Tax=Liparis tanakae TaxID=230148 RepID=A0A4Z2IV97_9TELE|nr:hypothetical protein EYF80_007880 [Liparis tanakae]